MLQKQTVQIDVNCIACNTVYNIVVNVEDIKKYQNGELIQNAFPYLTAAEREMLLSQLCDVCFNDAFKEDNWK